MKNIYPKFSLTEGSRALHLFTDRNRFIRLFAGYLNDEPCPETLLFFHGDGGNGKSLLLKYLREKCCKRIDPELWKQLRTMPEDKTPEAAAAIERSEAAEPVPCAVMDFGIQPREEDQPRDPFYGPLLLRRNISKSAACFKYRMKFPFYDFACFRYLYQKGWSSKKIMSLFPEEMELAEAVLKLAVDSDNVWISVARTLFNTLSKNLGDKAMRLWKQRGLDEQWVKELTRMDPDSEIVDRLPLWLAEDLNAAMTSEKSPSRFVLMFDTHEAFWGHERRLPDAGYFYRDEWFRRFLDRLDLKAGWVVAAAGREKPRWADAANFPIPVGRVNTQLVWHLTDHDAMVYLENAGISEPELRKALIEYARVDADQLHPFYLGLCADVVLAAGARDHVFLNPSDFDRIPGTAVKSEVLIQRLLKYVDPEIQDAIESLSACRSFDFRLYMKLGNALHFHATAAAFRTLTRFSFVWQDKADTDRFRIHSLLRRLYHDKRRPDMLRIHAGLEKYYRNRGNTAEAVYHRICRDPETGGAEWVTLFRQAKMQRNLDLCRTLIDIRNETSLYSDRLLRKQATTTP